MHEMSIAQNIIDTIQQNLPGNDDARVTSIKLKIGDLSGVVTDSLEFCFNVLIQGTILDRAKLIVETVRVKGNCRCCGKIFSEQMFMFLCPFCDSRQIDILAGRELEIVEFELSDKEESKTQ